MSPGYSALDPVFLERQWVMAPAPGLLPPVGQIQMVFLAPGFGFGSDLAAVEYRMNQSVHVKSLSLYLSLWQIKKLFKKLLTLHKHI